MEETMKDVHTMVAASGFALALATAMTTDVNRAEADAEAGRASNSQLRGQYAGTLSGGCLISLSGFDENNRPIDQTRTWSTQFYADSEYTFDGKGRKTSNNDTVVNIIAPGPNTPSVAIPSVGLSTGGGNFTYAVGPKNTVTVTLTDPVYKNLNGPAVGLSATIDKVVLEGHFGPNGVTLNKPDGAVEILTPSAGSPIHRICGRSIVLLSDHPRF
jgi:hypothetical protein